ncbi:hypothetical protein [Hyphobacterium sp.]|uniref:hypothetical protein n=1 Tax=Hyphobacterium sp. TaxID=2004662 RepID=UPI003747DEA5
MKRNELPAIGDRDAIKKFVTEFSAYSVFGSFEKVAEIATHKPRKTFNEVRAELFFYYRANNHLGVGFDSVLDAYEELYPYLTALCD